MKQKKLYMITTKDELELPLIVAETYAELSEKTHIDPASLRCCIARGYKGYHKVIIEDD